LKDANQELTFSVCVLASGSKGNAIFVSDGSTSILFDAGLSGVEIERRLTSRELSPSSINAIVVSHEHTDHIQGVGVLARRYKIPVYISHQTYQAAKKSLGKISDSSYFICGKAFCIGSLIIHPFSISHDANDPAGFTVKKNSTKLGIATDLGIATSMVREHLKECDIIILEANHDSQMLNQGPYPWPLKQRVKSRTGHLSNDDAKTLLDDVKNEKLKHVVLAHLSETNNTHEKAFSTVAEALNGREINLIVACQDRSSKIIRI
jgi:phosphoribosyl 1,2-cyclic phosphodiesterase